MQRGDALQRERVAVWHNEFAQSAARRRDLKLRVVPRSAKKGDELYNLSADPTESRDLSAQLPDAVDALNATLQRYADGMSDAVACDQPADNKYLAVWAKRGFVSPWLDDPLYMYACSAAICPPGAPTGAPMGKARVDSPDSAPMEPSTPTRSKASPRSSPIGTSLHDIDAMLLNCSRVVTGVASSRTFPAKKWEALMSPRCSATELQPFAT